MEFSKINERAKEIRALYAKLEQERYGQEWGTNQIAQGFVSDVGDLLRLMMSKDGFRKLEDTDKKLESELCDCLWSVLILADKLGIDLEPSFLSNMDVLEKDIKNNF